MPFSWKKYQDKCLAKKLYRANHLLRNNPDYIIKYPQEAKDNPKREVRKDVHKNIASIILKEHELFIRHHTTPTIVRPQRLSAHE